MLTTFLLNIERVDRSSENWEEIGKVHWIKVAVYATECIFCITMPPPTLASFDYICSSTTEELQVMRGAGCGD